MIFDSPLLSRDDIAVVRDAIRGLLLEGDHPETAALAPKVRQLVNSGVMTPAAGQLAATVYGYGGASLLDRQLDLLLGGRMILWRGLTWLHDLLMRKAPYRYEIDLVKRIAFRELGYAAEPDGLPLDPAGAIRETVADTTDFEGEPYDLAAEMPKFNWPTVVISGGRDLTTPPAVAERAASLLPDALLVQLPTMAHSALDTRDHAALTIAAAVCRGELDVLADRALELDALPAHPALRLLRKAIGLAATAEATLPALGRRVTQP